MAVRSSTTFYGLTVSAVETLTDDAVAITFEVPADRADVFTYEPGQHVVVKADIGGEDVRRTYSVAADAATRQLRIGVKRIAGGSFSTYATKQLQVGDRLDVGAPHGEFTIEPRSGQSRNYAAIAAGSGITPILSMIASTLHADPTSGFTLLFGNRSSTSIMFLEELAGLKDRFVDRFHLIHVLSREPQIAPLLSGRLDEKRLTALLTTVIDVGRIDAWYLCGPYEMVQSARAALVAQGVDPETVKDELFFAEPTPPTAPPVATDDTATTLVTFTLDGRTSSMRVDPDGPPLLTHALHHRRDIPFSCRGGMCTTCKAQVLTGSATMDVNFALTAEDQAKGYILTCQAHPTSDELAITYDV